MATSPTIPTRPTQAFIPQSTDNTVTCVAKWVGFTAPDYGLAFLLRNDEVIITREQVMAFFDLVPRNETVVQSLERVLKESA